MSSYLNIQQRDEARCQQVQYVPSFGAIIGSKYPVMFGAAQKQLEIANRIQSANPGRDHITLSIQTLSGDIECYRDRMKAIQEDPDAPFFGESTLAQATLGVSKNASHEEIQQALQQFETCVDALEKTLFQFQQMQSLWQHCCQIS